ncbi:GntR family transcriptional regulator [Streptomyces sp. NPDC020379]|uniref:GntR family transcriptional regulator n=1 Tax=Streptomyces sp. NPDC020379 TaxID=3365071 RepID=UPI003798A6F1
MSPEIERSLPAYMQVLTHLREQIVSGQLAEGDTVPSERQLAADWGIARATAAKVLNELRHEKLVISKQGSGTVVAARATLHHSPAERFQTAQTTGRIYPPGHYAKILSAGLAPASTNAALALGIEEGQDAIRRQRVTYTEDDAPASASISWFAAELAERVPELLRPERIIGGTPKAIEDKTGWSWEDGQDLVGASLATDEEAELLGITVRPAALLVGYNSLLDAEGAVIEYGEYITHGDRLTTYTYRRPRD